MLARLTIYTDLQTQGINYDLLEKERATPANAKLKIFGNKISGESGGTFVVGRL